jgi:hypothetical protein
MLSGKEGSAGAADSDVEEGNFGEIGTVSAWTVFSATSAAFLQGKLRFSIFGMAGCGRVTVNLVIRLQQISSHLHFAL